MSRLALLLAALLPLLVPAAEPVSFPSGTLTLQGVLYKPEGPGPFPAVVYNHGSAPGRLSRDAFGGLEAVLGAERAPYCAAIDSAGGAQGWTLAPELRAAMTRAVRNARAPIFFFQAANDYDLSPSRALSAAMKDAGKVSEMTIPRTERRPLMDTRLAISQRGMGR